MNKRFILGIFILLISIVAVEARLGSFTQDTCVDIVTSLDGTSNVDLSILKSPSSITLARDQGMEQNGTMWNYTTCATTQLGIYTYGYCDLDNDRCYSNDFEIVRFIGENDTGFSTSSLYIIMLLILGVFVYIKQSKIFGSVVVLSVGMGMIFTEPGNAWIGLAVAGIGVAMAVWGLIEKPSQRYGRGRYR